MIKKHIKKNKDNDDILKFNIERNLEYSDLDQKSKDKLIKEICSRVLELEKKKE